VGDRLKIRYRAWQFWNSFNSRPLNQTQSDEIGELLNNDEANLFHSQTKADQQHSYRVMRLLKESGCENEHLLAAALLHDVGKARAVISWWDRPTVVIGQALSPTWSERWADGEATGLRRPFVNRAKHADWGAEAATRAGSAPLTIELILRHHDPPAGSDDSHLIGSGTDHDQDVDHLVALLKWADSKC
jgi:hypothetical protein